MLQAQLETTQSYLLKWIHVFEDLKKFQEAKIRPVSVTFYVPLLFCVLLLTLQFTCIYVYMYMASEQPGLACKVVPYPICINLQCRSHI